MAENIEILRSEGVMEIQFARPSHKNALTLQMYEDAAAALTEADGDETVRVVLFSGHDGNFTSGNDLVDFIQNPPVDESSPVFQFLLALRRSSRPILAAVDGFAIGIGTTMLLHCDLAWAGAEARFRLPFVNLGLVPEAGSSLLLPALVGHRRAAELLYFGEFFDGKMAKESGIVNDVVDTDVVAYGRERAAELAKKPPMAVQQTKALLRRGDDEAVLEAMRVEAAVFVERLQSKEFLAAVAAFQK